MDRQIENPDTGERVTVTGDGFQTYKNDDLGRVFKDYGDGRLYEYDDNGKLMETAWTWVTDNPKHTPGPWEVEPSVDEFEGRTWCITGVSEHSGNRIRCNRVAADAALIAAAPDMYEALRAMVWRYEDTESMDDEDYPELAAARAALAKAEGE